MISCRKKQLLPRFFFTGLVFILVFILNGCDLYDDTSSTPSSDQQTQDGTDNQPPNADNDTPASTPSPETPTQGDTDNQPPNAKITAPQTSISGQAVTLNGSSSSDPDGDTLSYRWSQTEGPDITFSDSTSGSLTFIAPSVAQPTQLSFELTVNDGELSNSATVSVQISPMADDTGPSIVTRSPEENQSGVSTTPEISVSFDEALLETSVDSQSFLVSQNGNPVSGVVSYDSATNTITNKLASALTPDTTYTVTLANTLEDLAGNAFAGDSWSFSTAAEVIADGKCATAEEGNSLMLSCPTGQVITEVEFASFGTPDGSCGSFTTGSCNASNAEAVVSNACKGKNSCTLVAGNDSFGEPCEGTVKKLAAQVACGMATDQDSDQNLDTVTKQKFDFVVGVDGNFKAARIAAANAGGERFRIFFPNGEYDLGSQLMDSDEYETTDFETGNVSFIGQDNVKTVIFNTAKKEGLGTSPTLRLHGDNIYFQDVALQNKAKVGTGRFTVIDERGKYTIYKNVRMLSGQDTYYPKGDKTYWEGGEIHGTTDFICGQGDIFFNEVLLWTMKRSAISAPANHENKWGHVFSHCTIDGTADGYDYGRNWNGGASVFINTIMKKVVSDRGWGSGISGRTNEILLAEYNSTKADGSPVNTSKRASNATVLSASEAAKYTIENVLGGWDPRKNTKQVDAPVIRQEGQTITWDNAPDALNWVVFKNGEYIDNVITNSYDISSMGAGVTLTVRAANEMGGLGAVSNSVTTQ